MSAESIKMYEAHRAAKTLPPPAMAGGLREKANDLRRIAASILADANDLEAAAAALESR